jgi:hypothetical protein
MKTSFRAICLFIVVSFGCTHKYTARTDFWQKVKNDEVKITLKDNRVYSNVRLTRLESDSTSWISDGRAVTYASSDILDIRRVNRGRGARWKGWALDS